MIEIVRLSLIYLRKEMQKKDIQNRKKKMRKRIYYKFNRATDFGRIELCRFGLNICCTSASVWL
jgi:hypothetical protein